MRTFSPRSPAVILNPTDIEFILDLWDQGKTAPNISDLMAERGLDVSDKKISAEVVKARAAGDPRAHERNPRKYANIVRAA